MVGYIARYWQKLPHEIWDLPFGYYITLRDQYIEMTLPASKKTDAEGELAELNATSATEIGRGTTTIDYDAVIRQRRRKAGRHG